MENFQEASLMVGYAIAAATQAVKKPMMPIISHRIICVNRTSDAERKAVRRQRDDRVHRTCEFEFGLNFKLVFLILVVQAFELLLFGEKPVMWEILPELCEEGAEIGFTK